MQNCDIKAGGLLILQPLLQDEIIAALADGDAQTVSCGLARHYASQADGQPHEGLNPAALYVLRRLLAADNYFSRRMAAGGAALQPALLTAMAAEIALLQGWLADYQPPAWLQAVGEDVLALCPELADWAQMEPALAAAVLARFHQRFGFGQLALHRVWRWQGELQPVQQYDQISLSNLVGYQIQKDEVMANTRLFAREGRGNNLLLYGARGTGKSSLVKAAANELAAEGLCLVEMPLEYMASLPQLLALLAEQPRRYILFIDDLSFERADQAYKITKAVLEGSVAALNSNVLIYATSNRRHLIVENWQDREGVQHDNGEVRASDSMSEKLSLADRFGQTVLFSLPRQEEYLQIVQTLAAADGIALPPEELRQRALKWAMWQKHNGLSGRTARQFVNSLSREEAEI